MANAERLSSTLPRPAASGAPERVGRPTVGPWAVALGIVGGLAYCSWPLGVIVNPALASAGLASDLGAHGQPYAWLFVLLDCVTGVATLAASGLLWLRARDEGGPLPGAALLGYALFGVLTAVDALIPIGCGGAGLTGCGADLSRPNVDDVLTGLAVLALFAAAVATLRRGADGVSPSAFYAAAALLVAWSGTGLVFLANHFSTRPAVTLQHLFLTLSSVLSALVPALLVTRRERRSGVG